MLKVLYVPTTGISNPKEFANIDSILKALGITDKYETALINGEEKVGMIFREQDEEGLKQNRLGLKGDFAIIGMERLDPSSPQTPHAFYSLTDEQISEWRTALALQTYRDLRQK
jgi:hypothetical protein